MPQLQAACDGDCERAEVTLDSLTDRLKAPKRAGSAQNVGGSSRLWWFLYRIGRWAECSAEAIPEHAVVDGTPNLQQQIGTSS